MNAAPDASFAFLKELYPNIGDLGSLQREREMPGSTLYFYTPTASAPRNNFYTTV